VDYLKKFWVPGMRREIVENVRQDGGEDLAVATVREMQCS
jgi:hypothetical protein